MSAEKDDISLLCRIAVCSNGKSSTHHIREDATDAISELYDRYVRLVFSLAYQILHDRALAEEITQDVFIQVWNKAGTFHPENGKVITWLTSVTRYRAIDVLRRQNARPEGHYISIDEGFTLDQGRDGGIETAVEITQKRQQVHQALSALPIDQRKALILAYFHGMTHEEISKALEEPLGTVKTRIRLAMQKLRQSLIEIKNEDSSDI